MKRVRGASAKRQAGIGAFFLLLLASGSFTQAAEPIVVIHGLPPQAPAWVEGYKVRWPLRVIGDPAKQTAKTVIASLPTGGWLKPDAADLVVQTAGGQIIPVVVLSHDLAGETLIQFKRHDNDPWYWAYGVSARPLAQAKPDADFKEGLTVEVREWAGDDLQSWARVRDGLKKSETVIGNSVVMDVIQASNPARLDKSIKFAASYRGNLDIKKEGVYRFFANSDDAAFLFIDGFKVCERGGSNNFVTGTVKLKDLGVNVNLKAGVHAFEMHHVVGNNPQNLGRSSLMWIPPGQPKFSFVPREAFLPAMYARVADVQGAPKTRIAAFVHGNDDLLSSEGVRLYMVRFEAQGEVGDAKTLEWTFGDGTTGTGQSVTHVYFKGGDYPVSLKAGKDLPPFKRRVHVWPAPGETSPLSLGRMIRALSAMDWQKLELDRIQLMFAFLLICEQPERWALLEKVADHLLTQKEVDLQLKAQLYTAKMTAPAHLGKARDALKLADKVLPEFAKVPSLKIAIQMAMAGVHQNHLKEPGKASKIYKAILDDNKRLEHPSLRLAAVRWGDLFAEAGEVARANSAYRLAVTLGGSRFNTSAATDTITRGALMRIAEQKLKEGNIHQTRQLLERLELEHPGRQLDGLFCFLRGEADRFGGRYEQAQRHYESLLRLPQWAGYRDRALFGIADGYYRRGDLKKAQELFDTLKKSYPKAYEQRKLADVQKLIKARQERIQAAIDKGKPDSAFFKGFTVGFEPDDAEHPGEPGGFSLVRALGIHGPHVGYLDAFPSNAIGSFSYAKPLKNLNGDGTYWVEFWCRSSLGHFLRPSYAYGHVWIAAADDPAPSAPRGTQFYIDERSYGQWRKVGAKVKAPLAQDGSLRMIFYTIPGVLEIDGLSIRPVSDRQSDSLVSFFEIPEKS